MGVLHREHRYFAVTVTLTPTAITANSSAEQSFTVTGLQTKDIVNVNKPTAQDGLGIVGCRVSAANTLAITFGNFAATVLTPTAAEVYKVDVFRPEILSSTANS